MNIKINNKDFKIKPATELTVGEYVAYFKSIKKDSNNFENLINYVTVVTGMSYANVADIDIDEKAIRRLFAYIGEILPATKMPGVETIRRKKTGATLHKKPLNWRTIGARQMLESRKADTQLEQAVYLLAVYFSGDYDAEKAEEIYGELQDYNAMEVFGFIIFFFRKLLTGKK